MKYSRFIKILRKNFPNLTIKQRNYQEVQIYARYRHGNYVCFLVQIYFHSYKKIEITQSHFNGFEIFDIKSKDFYKVLQIINETFINAKNKFDIVGS